MPHEPTEKRPEGRKVPLLTHFIDSGLAELGGAIVTIGSGIVTGVQTIRNKFYSNANKKYGFFDGLDSSQPNFEYWRIDTHKHTTPEAITEAQKLLEEGYETAKHARLKELGMDKLGKQWKMLLKHQKVEVGVSVATVMAVGIGAILALAGTRNVSEEQKRLEERLEGKSPDQPQR